MSSIVRLEITYLEAFATRLFEAAGVPVDEARRVSESLVDSNLCGHPSHGVVRVGEYVQQMRAGELVAGAELETIRETPSLLVAGAGFGFGQIQARRLIQRLVPKAREQGIACGTMRDCGHVGRLGEWVEHVAGEDLAGLITVNDNGVLQCVAPPGGTEPRISTNPLAIGVPTSGEPMVLDISTSAVANGKIRVAELSGEQCPPGWLQDANGNPTTEPSARSSDPPGTLLPMGGEHGYKGFGLGLMLDFLVGGLSGGSCPPSDPNEKTSNNVLLVIWDPKRFAGESHFKRQVDDLIAYVRGVRLKQEVDAIRLPGDRGEQTRQQCREEGIPLDRGTWRELVDLAAELEVDVGSPDV